MSKFVFRELPAHQGAGEVNGCSTVCGGRRWRWAQGLCEPDGGDLTRPGVGVASRSPTAGDER